MIESRTTEDWSSSGQRNDRTGNDPQCHLVVLLPVPRFRAHIQALAGRRRSKRVIELPISPDLVVHELEGCPGTFLLGEGDDGDEPRCEMGGLRNWAEFDAEADMARRGNLGGDIYKSSDGRDRALLVSNFTGNRYSKLTCKLR